MANQIPLPLMSTRHSLGTNFAMERVTIASRQNEWPLFHPRPLKLSLIGCGTIPLFYCVLDCLKDPLLACSNSPSDDKASTSTASIFFPAVSS